MTLNEFWDFAQAAERFYGDYRRQIMERYSLSAAETDVLMFLANNPGYDTAAQVSRVRRIPKSQVSLCVNALCERGLLTGSHAPGDRKSVHLALTPRAEPAAAFGRAVQEEFSAALFSDFSEEEKAEFSRLHQKIAKNIESQRKDSKCKPSF